jgi:uncharacterized protein YmfQ (DUF2313 family)
MRDFDAGTIDTQRQGLANVFPSSREWRAKNVPQTNVYKLIKAMSYSFFRLDKLLDDVAQQLDIRYTTDLIENWERAFGIPNSSFDINVDIIQRRAQVLATLRAQGCTTVCDFINLIQDVFGYEHVSIVHGRDFTDKHPPYKVPFQPVQSDDPTLYWTWYIYGDNLIPENHPPYAVPFRPTGANTPMTRFVQKLKPLNTILIFRNNPLPTGITGETCPPDNTGKKQCQ